MSERRFLAYCKNVKLDFIPFENAFLISFAIFVATAAVVEGTIFCAHAGLSPELSDLDLVS